jgi:hypothetical protein
MQLDFATQLIVILMVVLFASASFMVQLHGSG